MNNFEEYTDEELFYHLIDNYIVSNVEKFDNWKDLRNEMINLCKENEKKE